MMDMMNASSFSQRHGWTGDDVEVQNLMRNGYRHDSKAQDPPSTRLVEKWQHVLNWQRSLHSDKRQPPQAPHHSSQHPEHGLYQERPACLMTSSLQKNDQAIDSALVMQLQQMYQDQVQSTMGEQHHQQAWQSPSSKGFRHQPQLVDQHVQQPLPMDNQQYDKNCWVPYYMVPTMEANVGNFDPHTGEFRGRRDIQDSQNMVVPSNWQSGNQRGSRKGMKNSRRPQAEHSKAFQADQGVLESTGHFPVSQAEAVAGTGETPILGSVPGKERKPPRSRKEKQFKQGMDGNAMMAKSDYYAPQQQAVSNGNEISNASMGLHTMKEQLEALRLEDPSRVFIARRINKLGFASAELLKANFSQYGQVKCVLVSHSRVKSFVAQGRRCHGSGEHQRLRAAGLGFVVMSSAEDTARILAEGPEHFINGVGVQLKPFQRYNGELADPDQIPSMESMEYGYGKGDVNVLNNVILGADYSALGARERWPSPGSD
jgi:hypothetical protein